MAKRKRKKTTMSDQLRDAIENCGQSRYAIHKATGIDQGQLSRFMHGEAGMSLDTVDRLFEYLELELRSVQREQTKG